MKGNNADKLKDNTSSIIVSIPHSSYKITKEMKRKIKEDVFFANNDWYLNELYSFLKEFNIPIISAEYSRYVIDVNRKLEYENNHDKYNKSLIYYKTTFNKDIYKSFPSEEEKENRIKFIYEKYHKALLNKIEETLKLKGKVYLFDLHSFYAQSDADIVLGTQYGSTCSREFLHIVYNAFIEEGFTVKVDEIGLRGGYITYHYGAMSNVEAMQIEIRYTSYIENRYFGEEFKPEINIKLFSNTQKALDRAFIKIKNNLILRD